MERVFIEETVFEDLIVHDNHLAVGDYENCTFRNCDLRLTTFHTTNLEGADLRTSLNYSIDPEHNRIKKAKFSLPGSAGLLEKYDIEIEN